MNRLPTHVDAAHGSGANEVYLHKDVTEGVIGCAIRVHRQFHAGYLESVYENALAHELAKSGLRAATQVKLNVHYDGVLVGEHRADLVVERKVVVELKAVSELTQQHLAQLLSTMRAANLRVGLLINFNEVRLVDGVRRIVL